MKNLILSKIAMLATLSIMMLLLSNCNEDDGPPPSLGSYTVIETCGSGNINYDITIIQSGSGKNAIIISNLYNLGKSVSASVNGSNISIPSQLINGVTYSGNGSLSDNTLTINYTVSDADESDNCNAICTRK